MARLIAAITLIAVVSGATGCASTWETLSSRRFRDKPFGTMFGSEDPVEVLRTNPDGEAQARAMRKLKEPAAEGRSQADQDEVMERLTNAATTDPSPWVRVAAIDALGRFQDPRAITALTAAYDRASGRSAPDRPAVQQVAAKPGEPPRLLTDRLGLHGPQGFPDDQAANIRGRALDALARTGRPEAIAFLERVAGGQDIPIDEDPSARDFVRQRAVEGLGRVRQKEAVYALARVLAAENGKDVALTDLAREGLVNLTGQDRPADPQAWNEVIQAGFEIAPEPNFLQRTQRAVVGTITD